MSTEDSMSLEEEVVAGEFDNQTDQLYNITNITNTLKHPHHSKLSENGDSLFGTILSTFCFLSILGNCCILLLFWLRQRKLNPAEVFLLNLGVVDILLSVASYPMAIISSFSHQWEFGQMGCDFYAFICYFLGVASIFSVTGIAVIRYLKTCILGRSNQINCWTCWKMIGWGYLLAFLWALLPLTGFGKYGFEPFQLSCTLDWVAKDKASRLYVVLVSVFCVILPTMIIVFCYSRIIFTVRQTQALMRNSGVNRRNMKGPDLQLTWVAGMVTLGFVIAWGPYTITSLWSTFRGDVLLPMWATPIPVLFAKSSIVYNPLIYLFLTTTYRKEFLAILHRFRVSRNGSGRQVNNNAKFDFLRQIMNKCEGDGNMDTFAISANSYNKATPSSFLVSSQAQNTNAYTIDHDPNAENGIGMY